MFAYIKGELNGKFSNYVVIEANGVGYKIFMSENAIDNVGNIGDIVKVYTHYHVREDDISLYGFNTNEELKMFELLISVSGIGAKSAIVILSNIAPLDFALAIISNDTKLLTKIPGIGAKTAARMVLELKDKIKTEDSINGEKSTKEIKKAIQDDDKVLEAISALQVLGYNRKEIEKAFETLNKENLSVEDLIRKGLSCLSK